VREPAGHRRRALKCLNPEIRTRISEELRDEYERKLQLEGRSISEDLRQHIRDVVRDGAETSGLPEEPELREAYVLLDELASPDDRRVQASVAISELAQKTQRPEESVKRAVLEPLRNRGHIYVWNGWVTVQEAADAE